MKPASYFGKLLTLVLLFIIASGVVYSASSGTGYSIPVGQDFGQDGSIVSLKDGNYILADTSYQDTIYGVISDNPSISLQDISLAQQKFVVASGDADILVSTINGPIKTGDFITSSNKPGVGMKATRTGQIVGVATQDFDSPNPDDIGKILVFVDIRSQFISQSNNPNVLTALKAGLDSQFLSPLISLRYIMAALVAAVSFFIAFRNFGRISGSSVEALGRNPLASAHIRRIVTFNFILTFLIMVSGLVVAYLILIL